MNFTRRKLLTLLAASTAMPALLQFASAQTTTSVTQTDVEKLPDWSKVSFSFGSTTIVRAIAMKRAQARRI
jgi:hypothetical protein